MKFGTPMNYGIKFGTLIDYAKRKTGLGDFGDDGHLHALEVLVTSINDEAELTATGRLIQKSRLTSALVQRLRVEELFKKHPEIHDIDLGKIIMVTGLQRSGTTLLQRLLNTNPDFRGESGVEGLESQDHTQTYEYFRKVLKVICRQRPGKNWVLKTPHHMEYLDVFMKVFPKATIIQTHRDPRKTLPSFCSMVTHAHAIFSYHVDPKEIA